MFKTYIGNPYKIFSEGDTICVTTNGIIKKGGKAVMGRGSAQFARDVFGIDGKLGEFLTKYGNRAFYLGEYEFPKLDDFENSNGKKLHLATFPTKHHWRDKSDLDLIELSAVQMVHITDKFSLQTVYIPFPGGGYGGLVWKDVRQRLQNLDERFIVYSLKEDDFYE